MQPRTNTVLIANPSADVYGSDLQMLESVTALREHGWRVVVVLPGEGPLVRRLLDRGAEVRLVRYPVLCRSAATPTGLPRLGLAVGRAVPALREAIRAERPALLYVNTVTLPWWLFAARGTGVPTLCHVHEAEAGDPAVVRLALATPLRLADTVVVNSRTTEEVVLGSVPGLRPRTRLLHNGVSGPTGQVAPPRLGRDGHRRIAVVGRLSARKAPHVVLAAAALLRGHGYDVGVDLVGTPGPGQEEYVAGLHARAEEGDLRGAVRFAGYCDPVWPALEGADVLVAPSLGESFGNAVVEGQLAGRPVVATAVQGHCETVAHGQTGLLVPPRDVAATAEAVARLLDHPTTAARLAVAGRRSAQERFGSRRYRSEVAGVVAGLAGVPAAAALADGARATAQARSASAR